MGRSINSSSANGSRDPEKELSNTLRAARRMEKTEGKLSDEIKQRIAYWRNALNDILGRKKTTEEQDQLFAEASRLIDPRRQQKPNAGMMGKEHDYRKPLLHENSPHEDRIGRLIFR